MALTAIDQTIYYVNEVLRSCCMRRMMIAQGADPGASGLFPLNGQFKDTKAGMAPRLTTDSKNA